MLRRLISQFLLLGLFALSVSSVYANDPNLTAGPTVLIPMVLSPGESKMTPNSFEQQVLSLVNQERAKAGCSAVTIDASLMMASSNHSEDMANNNFFDHTGSDGSSVAQRATAAGAPRMVGYAIHFGPTRIVGRSVPNRRQIDDPVRRVVLIPLSSVALRRTDTVGFFGKLDLVVFVIR